MRVAIIGAGAAGCFCAANLMEAVPGIRVTVFESGKKPMAKLAITGGGRCNITNSFASIRSLSEAYPRGERLMKRALEAFPVNATIGWFTSHGVPLVLQDDDCWFPRSQDAMDVVHCLMKAMKGAEIRLGTPISSVERAEEGILVDGELFDRVLISTGGAPKGLPFLDGLALETVPPVPSLFTFNVADEQLKKLMGIVVNAKVSLPGTGFKADGPLLITDWGLSGPAALKLSSYAARHLSQCSYKGTICINWLCLNESQARELLSRTAAENPGKMVSSARILPSRLWEMLTKRAALREDLRWAELGSKGFNRLISTLTNDSYHLSGKGRFRDEFVTCGGVALSNIDLNTLECKSVKGLYFAGEVLDVDAITGGFNLQAAWSTGYVAAQSIIKNL